MNRLPSWVIITPARNEAGLIRLTLESMIAQTTLPLKWVIVSDASTDGTDEVVLKYALSHPWIELVRMPDRAGRSFAGKAVAFNAGYSKVKFLHPEVIGNLDADVSVGPDHFEYLLTQCGEDPQLGVWGAPFQEGSRRYNYRFSNIENVWGGCQLFRRECYEAIGGYVPAKDGGIDHIAVVSARMIGWKTRTFPDRLCVHHRAMGTAELGTLKARFAAGIKDYSVGNHPLWELFRAMYQMSFPPVITGGVVLAAGYFWSLLRRMKRPVSRDLVSFTRKEQMNRLKRFLLGA